MPMRLSNKHLSMGIFVAAIAVTILFPRIFQLDHFVTPDELLWVARSANFYSALRNGNISATYQREHPGVTAMWAGSVAFLLRYPEYGQSGYEQVNWEGLQSQLEKTAQIKPLDILATARRVIVLVITLILLLAFYLAQRLIGIFPAVLAFVLIAFDPFQIGLSRLFHLDALLASLMFLSLLAFLSFVRENRALYLVISAIAAGLACLTKSPGLILVPVIGFLTLAGVKSQDSNQSTVPAKYIWRSISVFAVWLSIMGAVSVILWPALWQKPALILATVLTNTRTYIVEGHPTSAFFNGNIYHDGKITTINFYLWSYLWRTTPVTLLGLILSAWAIVTRRKPFDQPGSRFVAFGCLLFVLSFGMVMTIGAKKFDRYIMPVFLPLSLLSGIGWAALFYSIRDKFSRTFTKYAIPILILSIVGCQIYASIKTFPYYLTFYNPLAGGVRRAPQVMLIGWGEGLDEAGRYLSQKPNSKKLRVLSWMPYGSLSYFFPGKVRPILSDADFSQEDLVRLDSVDYVVIYVQQWQLNIPKSLLEYLSNYVPEHIIWINGIEYARIYALR